MYVVIIIGAGPIGLSAAIAASRRNLKVLVVEKGILVNSIYHFPLNMTFFSDTSELEIGDVPLTTSSFKPTRFEVLNYYRRVVDHYRLDIRFHTRVDDLKKEKSTWIVHTENGEELVTKNVVMATGYFDNPNELNVPGEELPKVSHYYSDSHYFYKKKVVVIGGRNSAIEAALEIYRAGGEVTMVHRGEWFDDMVKYWILPDIENRIGFGEIEAYFSSKVAAIDEKTVTISVKAEREIKIPNDHVLALVGYHPDVSLMRGAGVSVDEESLVPEHDKKTFETNVEGLYIAGSLTVGKNANQIFIFNGRAHGDVIMSAIEAKSSS